MEGISTPNVSVGRSRYGFYFRPTSLGLFWYFFGTSSHLPLSREKPRKTPRPSPAHAKLPSLSLLLMEQLVASYGLFSSHHFQLFYFAGFFSSLPHPTGLVSRHPLTQRKKS